MWITTNGGNLFKRREYHATLPVFQETLIQAKTQQLKSDMEQCTGSKLGKQHVKVVYWHPTYLTYMQSTSGEMPD